MGCYDTYGNTTYTITVTPCTSVSASTQPGSPQAVGTPITITASAAGCPNPRFEFWILPPGGSWTIMQAYSSTSTFSWNTTPPAGTYYYSVWGRDASSSASYDAYFPGTAYTLT
jgi:cell wall-associated protease